MALVDAVDRVPTQPGRWSKSNESSSYVTLTRADEPIKEGTIINRALIMALQGFAAQTTTFGSDGSITETSGGCTKKTIFNSDGSITETFTAPGGTIQKKITFNSNGSITEAIV